jgi:DNA-binding LacI/PurR family transcriptional regulator
VTTEHARAASMRDVAALAGVSHQTVSRVINGHPSIRPATRDRVLAAMDQLRYRPNRAARALVTSRSRTLGVLSTSAAALYGPVSAINAIQDAGYASGYSVAVAQLAELTPEAVSAGLDQLLAQSVEGIILIAPQEVVLERMAAARVDVPYVTLLGGTAPAHRELSVDQVGGARAAVRHLVDLGHRSIAHLSGPMTWFEAQARLRGYTEELAAAGLQRLPSVEGDWTSASGYRGAQRLLDRGEATAVFASNDQMALGVYHAALERGLSIPGELSVVGFDDIPEAAHFWPPLTTVRQDFADLGRRSVESLLAEVEGGHEPVAVRLRPELVVRGSTSAPGGPRRTEGRPSAAE